jgi:transcriptional regulator with XRE-family HTH domain
MSEKIEQIITDEQLNKAWGNANFGSIPKREVLRNTLLKCASGFLTGHTAKCIVEELGLVHRSKWQLSSLGKRYLFAAYPEDLSAPASPIEEIGQKLKLMREKEGLTPKDVLDKTGISLVYLDRLENGELKSHSASVLYKLSELYKIDLKPLLVEAEVIIKKSDESKPSPVIEIGEEKTPIPESKKDAESF